MVTDTRSRQRFFSPSDVQRGDTVEFNVIDNGVTSTYQGTVTVVKPMYLKIEYRDEHGEVFETRVKPKTEPVWKLTDSSTFNTDDVQRLIDKLSQTMRDGLEADLEMAVKSMETNITKAVLGRVSGFKGVEVTQGNLTIGRVLGKTHAAFADIAQAVKAGFKNLLLIGPSGSGKTTLATQIATALKLDFDSLTFTSGATEADLVGRMIPNLRTGKAVYAPTPFVEWCKAGGLFLGDELDGGDANMLLRLNTLLANGRLTLPNGQEIKRHKDAVFIGAANTYGHGATRMYVGRNQLDSATLDRFVGATFDLDYDKDLERAIAHKYPTQVERLWRVRDRVAAIPLRRVVSTRAIEAMCRWKTVGCDDDTALRKLFVGWSIDELRQVGEPTLYTPRSIA